MKQNYFANSWYFITWIVGYELGMTNQCKKQLIKEEKCFANCSTRIGGNCRPQI